MVDGSSRTQKPVGLCSIAQELRDVFFFRRFDLDRQPGVVNSSTRPVLGPARNTSGNRFAN